LQQHVVVLQQNNVRNRLTKEIASQPNIASKIMFSEKISLLCMTCFFKKFNQINKKVDYSYQFSKEKLIQ